MGNQKLELKKTVNLKNKKASHEYQFLDTYEAGIMLTGTEIKSIRLSKVNFSDSYCLYIGEELFLRGLHISPYEMGNIQNHEAKRDRKLLLKKRELLKWLARVKEEGLTMVPTRIFINDKGLAKVEIALAKGKKLYDKREDIKKKDMKREIDRHM